MRSTPDIIMSSVLGARRAADLQLAWVDAADDAHEAYLAWGDAAKADRSAAFVAYQAALDREEAAARALELEVRGPRL
jgi:hypothetical protein